MNYKKFNEIKIKKKKIQPYSRQPDWSNPSSTWRTFHPSNPWSLSTDQSCHSSQQWHPRESA